MTAPTNPKNYRSAIPADPRVSDEVMALAVAAVVDQLTAKWTNWRIELGVFDEGTRHER